jgi:all-trans-retinol 13,14-reductase
MYDAIIIGSGIGGMAAAGLLAGVAGKKVLVLEKHTEPGGLTHTFRRDGAAWDVGLHYVGDMAPGSQPRAFFDYLSAGRLRWNRMTDAFERFVYPGIDFKVPSDPQKFEQRLIAAWPDEVRAIRRYFRDIRRVVRWTTLGFARGMVPGPVQSILWFLQRMTGRIATQTTHEYLQAHIRSPQLRALLATQWGDYGVPPARSAFAIHAQIVHHYLNGAWFPEGGSAHIARSFESGIEGAGGEIRVAQEVTRILIEDGRAVGVEVIDRRGPQPHTMIHRAPIVISNAGAPITFERLLPTNGAVGAATAPLRELVRRLGTGMSAVTLYLRLKADARTIGVQGENHWINTCLDHDDTLAQTHGVLTGSPRSIYVSFPSIKAGEARFHTAEIIAFVDDNAFAAWRDKPKGNRGSDYSALKQRIGDGMLRLADAHIPGLAALAEYQELATPLTVEHYTSHPGGRFYGLAATPERYRSPLLGPRTPIEGLYLAGSDAGCLGIVGALMGGVGAACQALGVRGMPMIRAALKSGARPVGDQPLPETKKRAMLTAKEQLTTTIWRLVFEVEGKLGAIAPGQFARLHVGGDEWRDYSIADVEGRMIQFLISTGTGGHGSRFVQQAVIGTRTLIELPLGQYTLSPNAHQKVFVATGTGIAPFLPMFRALDGASEKTTAVLVFGCRTAEEDITLKMMNLPSTVIRCYSRADAPQGGIQGRVTDALARIDFDPELTDFYLCGSSDMVANCHQLLEGLGARHLFVENY